MAEHQSPIEFIGGSFEPNLRKACFGSLAQVFTPSVAREGLPRGAGRLSLVPLAVSQLRGLKILVRAEEKPEEQSSIVTSSTG